MVLDISVSRLHSAMLKASSIEVIRVRAFFGDPQTGSRLSFWFPFKPTQKKAPSKNRPPPHKKKQKTENKKHGVPPLPGLARSRLPCHSWLGAKGAHASAGGGAAPGGGATTGAPDQGHHGGAPGHFGHRALGHAAGFGRIVWGGNPRRSALLDTFLKETLEENLAGSWKLTGGVY